MWLVARKMMRHDLGMMVPAGIAIVVGTLFIAMTFLFGNTMDVSMRRMVSSDAAQANYAIIPADGKGEGLQNRGAGKSPRRSRSQIRYPAHGGCPRRQGQERERDCHSYGGFIADAGRSVQGVLAQC